LLDNTTDWVDAAFQTGHTYNVEAQARGGNDKTRFFASAGFFEQEGTLIESDFNRLSTRMNLDHFASDKLDFSLNFNATYSQQLNAVSGNRFQSPIVGAFINTPLQGSRNPETGELYTGLESDWIGFVGDNFQYSQPLNYVNINTFRLLSKATMNYNILKNLRFTQTANIDWLTLDEKDFDDLTTNDGVNQGGNISQSFSNARTLTTQSLLKYYTTVGSDHNIDALVGFEFQRYRLEDFNASGQGFASGKLQTLNSAAEANGVPSGIITDYSFVSALAQLNYNFREKYLLTVSGRRDGSSRFGANNRYATFWSVGGSWILSSENFLENGPFDNLRLRASYGTAGNAAIGNFASLQLYGFGAAYLNLPGSAPSQIGNPDLTWEKSNNLNIGLDFGILNNRLSGTVEWYRRVSSDLLLNVPVSSTSGFTSALQNVGELENTGVELTLSAVPVQSATPDGFNWSLDFNISFNRNKSADTA
jgi:outer membrane receptor protein involved in Fe transport